MNWKCKLIGHSYPDNEHGDHGYCERCDGYLFMDFGPEGQYLSKAYRWVKQHILNHICGALGHDFKQVDHDMEGGVDMECQRCGLHYHGRF